ncbi:hypothetical protein SEPCBS57363_003147 [Sporothrix epigloea]|uniref:Uncharacterized protein n=1 Tax=Sporothrix epigloea TaxID=1892477 RepID=A0ABP0DJV8_9PEZI
MRSTGAFLSVLAATTSLPLAATAPIPNAGSLHSAWDRLLADVYSRTLNLAHNLAPKTTPTITADSGLSTVVIDNRHYTPSADTAPSVVLATRRPIVTTYLMGLGAIKSHSSSPPTGDALSPKDKTVPKPAPIRLPNTHDGVEVVMLDKDVEEAQAATKTTTDTPDSAGPVISPTIIANVEEWDAAETRQKLPPGFVIPPSLLMESRANRP